MFLVLFPHLLCRHILVFLHQVTHACHLLVCHSLTLPFYPEVAHEVSFLNSSLSLHPCDPGFLHYCQESVSFLFVFNLFIFGCVGSSLLSMGFLQLQREVGSGGYSLLWCVGFSWWWLLLLQSTGSRHAGFSSCGAQAQQLWLVGSRAQAQQLWRTGLVAPRHVGSSWNRARTVSPSIGRWTLNHCATREVPDFFFNGCITVHKVVQQAFPPHALTAPLPVIPTQQRSYSLPGPSLPKGTFRPIDFLPELEKPHCCWSADSIH